MGYALGNLFTTVETFDPFSTPAAEIRIIPFDTFYLKSMVMAGDPMPFSHNRTGFVPEFHGNPVVVSEIGFTPGQKAWLLLSTRPPTPFENSLCGCVRS
jgi:porin